MYAIVLETKTEDLHEIHRAKLKQYKFKRVKENTYECENTVDDVEGVLFYKRNLCEGHSNFIVTGRKTGRII